MLKKLFVLILLLFLFSGCDNKIDEEKNRIFKNGEYDLQDVLTTNYFYECNEQICIINYENQYHRISMQVDIENNMFYYQIHNIYEESDVKPVTDSEISYTYSTYLSDTTEYNYKTKNWIRKHSSKNVTLLPDNHIASVYEQSGIKLEKIKYSDSIWEYNYSNGRAVCTGISCEKVNNSEINTAIEYFETILRQYNIEVQ